MLIHNKYMLICGICIHASQKTVYLHVISSQQMQGEVCNLDALAKASTICLIMHDTGACYYFCPRYFSNLSTLFYLKYLAE
jgi:hypothetical protein